MAKQDIGDLEQIRLRIESWLQEKLSNAQDLRLDTLKFPEESGESSVTLLMTAHWAGDTGRFVCRMKPLHSEVFDSHDLLLQYQLMTIIAEHGIAAPTMVGYESDETLIGSDFYIMHFVDGQIPTDNPPYAFGSWVTELTDDERQRMWGNGLQALSAIHSIDIRDYDLPSLPRSGVGQSPVQHEIDKFVELINDELQESLPPVLFEALDYVKANAPKDCVSRLCWGDSRVGNIIWQGVTPVAVIDWEMASLADPLMDVSWWYWIDYINSVGLGAERLGGLPDRPELYQRWHALTGLSIANSDYYDLFNVVRYCIILERKFAAMKAAGMGSIDNFTVPFVAEMLAVCQSD